MSAAAHELVFEKTKGATIAQEVNLIKQASQQNMELALKKEASLAHGEAID